MPVRALVAALLSAALILTLPTASAWAGNVPVPTSGAYMGASPEAGGPVEAGIKALDTKTGVKHVLSRTYYQWDTLVSSTGKLHVEVTDAIAAGRTPVISVKSAEKGGTPVRFATIASGARDADIKRMAQALKATGKPIMFAYMHEPEDQVKDGWGTTAEYQAAWRHIVTVMRAEGATNLSYTWIMTHFAFEQGTAAAYYPGDAYIDWISTDGYAWNGCNGGKQPDGMHTFESVMIDGINFAKAHGKPLAIGEYGVHAPSTQNTAKANWFTAARSAVKAHPEIKALMYFNHDNHDGSGCTWSMDKVPAITAAYKAMGTDPYFTLNPLTTTGGGGGGGTGADTTAPTASITSPKNGATVTGSFAFTANATDAGSGMSYVSFRINGAWYETDNAAPWAATSVPLSKLIKGTNTLEIRALDKAGNTRTVTITVKK